MDDAFARGNVQRADRGADLLNGRFIRRSVIDRFACGSYARTHKRPHGSVTRRSALLYTQ